MTNDKLKPILKQIDQLRESLLEDQQQLLHTNKRINLNLRELDTLEDLIKEYSSHELDPD
jgi:hypothetical protein